MTTTPSRQPQGIPVGGQFAPTTHAEPAVGLAGQVTPFHDADGTDWEFGGDEYTDVYTSFTNGIEARVTSDIREGGARATVVDHRGHRPVTNGEQTHFESLDEAKAHAKSVRERANRYGSNQIAPGDESPWETIQEVQPMAPGIDAVYTAGHGGLKLTPERNLDVDPAWREILWYEEDCAWSKAVLTHHADLPADHVTAAHETARRWYPDQYEAVVGKDPAKYGVTDYQPITTAESHVVEERQFLAARAGTHDKVKDVVRDLPAHPGKVAVTLTAIAADGRESEPSPAGKERIILVPEAEWHLPPEERHTFPKANKYQELQPAV